MGKNYWDSDGRQDQDTPERRVVSGKGERFAGRKLKEHSELRGTSGTGWRRRLVEDI